MLMIMHIIHMLWSLMLIVRIIMIIVCQCLCISYIVHNYCTYLLHVRTSGVSIHLLVHQKQCKLLVSIHTRSCNQTTLMEVSWSAPLLYLKPASSCSQRCLKVHTWGSHVKMSVLNVIERLLFANVFYYQKWCNAARSRNNISALCYVPTPIYQYNCFFWRASQTHAAIDRGLGLVGDTL